MAYQEEVLVYRPAVPALDPIRWQERTDFQELPSDLYMHAMACVHTHTNIHMHTKILQNLLRSLR